MTNWHTAISLRKGVPHTVNLKKDRKGRKRKSGGKVRHEERGEKTPKGSKEV